MLAGALQRHAVTRQHGLVIFGFGFLKYFPGISPAQALVLKVNHALTFGLMPDRVTLILFATVESIIACLDHGWDCA